MKQEVIQAFVDAARNVLVQEMGDPVELQRPRLQGGPYQVAGLTVVVGLAQGVEGAILLGMSQRTALQYVSHVMGETVDELDDLALSGIGELGNLIAGASGARLAAYGYDVVIAPPAIFMGEHATITTLNVARLVVQVQTPCGAVDVQLAARLPH